MSHEELLADLQKKGEEQVREMWRKAETEVNELKAEAARRIDKERESLGQREAAACEVERTSVLMRSDREANQIISNSEQTLAERLYLLAQESLQTIRDQKYASVFTHLAGELPGFVWDEVMVHPADQKMAETLFKKSNIVTDKSIAGGLKAIGNNGKVYIDNTLEKRLERAWPTLLPQIIKEIKELLETDELVTHLDTTELSN